MAITLRAARVNSGYTQKEAADKIGISVDTLGKYERGLSFPNVPVITAIEKAYNISYKDIIFYPQITVKP